MTTTTATTNSTFQGKTWQDMPGNCEIIQRCNFFLFVRGLYDPNPNTREHQSRLREVAKIRAALAEKQIRR